jgi:superfamily II DNA or RNA helicase
MELIDKYNIYIRDSYNNLIYSGKEINNKNLSKIFEYYSCIQLSKKYNQHFYEYKDIDPNFKEENKMTRKDTGIDACNKIDTIVQCKLRKNTLTWQECSTFFGSQNIFNSELKKIIVRWTNLIITRNQECKLSKNLKEKEELFTDITYSHDELISYCDNLIKNPPKIKELENKEFKLRNYQLEAIEIINKSENVIISLPTGSGKNIVIIFSIDENKRYLILVPRIILMDQIKREIIRYRPDLKNKIQTIGDNNNEYDETKNITICVYNSVSVVEKYSKFFDKIFIDEAHHINIPEIYEVEQIEDDNESIEENDNIINDDEFNISDKEYYSEDEKESILKDDTEDEIKNTTGYNKIIKNLSKYNNNVYLSATIDEIKDFTYYKKDIREMIEQKYLCDYTIQIPIFSDDPSDKNICEHLVNNYRNIIIYCNSQKEGKKINGLLNILQKGCSEYVDCKTSRKKRDMIIESYKEGLIPFLVNVRVLVEGFDAPITKGVLFVHLPSNETTIIQIIGRALRPHPLKTYANIILPFSSKEDECNINKFLKTLAQNDKRIKKSYESKTEGGYISIEIIKDEEDNKNNEDIEFRYNMIYDSMGILQNGEEIWMKTLEEVKKYIDENNYRPSANKQNSNPRIQQLGRWINIQKYNYDKKIKSMSNKNNYNEWTIFINDIKYKKHILITPYDKWYEILEKCKEYIDKNRKRPNAKINIDKNIKQLGEWIGTQTKNYKNKTQIMSNNEIYNTWNEFINDEKYKIHFCVSNEDIWYEKLDEVKQYINKNHKRPTECIKDNEEIKKLGRWLCQQIVNNNKQQHLLTNNEIKNEWNNFITDPKYKEHFKSRDNDWYDQLNKVKEYINVNKKRPSSKDKNQDIKKLGMWIVKQKKNYNNKKFIMSDNKIYDKWKEFITDPQYSIYF